MSTIGADALSIGGASSFGTSSTLVTPTEDVVIDPLKRDFVTPAEILAEGLGLVPIAGPYLEKVLKTYAKLTASVDSCRSQKKEFRRLANTCRRYLGFVLQYKGDLHGPAKKIEEQLDGFVRRMDQIIDLANEIHDYNVWSRMLRLRHIQTRLQLLKQELADAIQELQTVMTFHNGYLVQQNTSVLQQMRNRVMSSRSSKAQRKKPKPKRRWSWSWGSKTDQMGEGALAVEDNTSRHPEGGPVSPVSDNPNTTISPIASQRSAEALVDKLAAAIVKSHADSSGSYWSRNGRWVYNITSWTGIPNFLSYVARWVYPSRVIQPAGL